MTYYWPTSAIMHGLQPNQRRELMASNELFAYASAETMFACRTVAFRLPACTSMAIVCSKGAPMRRVYLEHPKAEDWAALERGGFMATDDTFGFLVDALH